MAGLVVVRREGRGTNMSTTKDDTAAYGMETAELELTIAAPPERVWQAMVAETTAWWSKDFYTSSAAKGFVIEPRLGGHAFEDWGGGAGVIWYTVIAVDAPRSLVMQGMITPAFGGPTQTLLQLTLEGRGAGTVLKLSDTRTGRVGNMKGSDTREGWRMLFEDGLKAHVERQG